MSTKTQNEAMIDQGVDDDGCGVDVRDVVRAVQMWSVLHPSMTQTVSEAAKVFNLTPDFLAQCIRNEENPFFFLSEALGDEAAVGDLTLEHDGL